MLHSRAKFIVIPINDEPVSLQNLQQNLVFSVSIKELLQSLVSLQKHSFLQKVANF